ncbi:hypothetical protein L484_027579 [Morus notabilis]|uniref:Uncharacterized protein n=1 Tax=Morus notabilis TaxID=981085 RepID=W9RC81_9ROSA|nr:hypothetical protein L484_027579 [Morus notabilis]
MTPSPRQQERESFEGGERRTEQKETQTGKLLFKYGRSRFYSRKLGGVVFWSHKKFRKAVNVEYYCQLTRLSNFDQPAIFMGMAS